MKLSDFDLCCYLKAVGIAPERLEGSGRVMFVYDSSDESLITDHMNRYNTGKALCDPLALANSRSNMKGWIMAHKENNH